MPVLLVIPARYASTRYPGKPLVELRGATGEAAQPDPAQLGGRDLGRPASTGSSSRPTTTGSPPQPAASAPRW